MPRATLEFDLPDDLPEFNLATHGGDWWAIVSKLDEECRRRLRHDPELAPEASEVLDWVRDFIREEKAVGGLLDPP